MKFMLIIMSVASHSHMGNFIWKFHLPAEISPCSIPYQYDVEKRRREKITQTYFRKKGCVRKNSTLLTRKMVRQIKVSVMDIPFEAYLWGKKKKKITGQQAIAAVYMWDKEANYMNVHKTRRTWSARPHSQKM